jgi:hypothetical protein
MRYFIGAGLVLLFGFVSASALATPVTFSFTGSVTDDPFGLSSFGAPISGNYTFDSAAVDTIGGGTSASYPSTGAGFDFNTTVDGTPYSVSGTVTVNILNAFEDQYGVIADDGALNLQIFFSDTSGTAFSSVALPLLPPPTGDFAFRQFRLFGTDVEFLGTVDTLVCTAGCDGGGGTVPEPGTLLLLLGAGLAGFARRRR